MTGITDCVIKPSMDWNWDSQIQAVGDTRPQIDTSIVVSLQLNSVTEALWALYSLEATWTLLLSVALFLSIPLISHLDDFYSVQIQLWAGYRLVVGGSGVSLIVRRLLHKNNCFPTTTSARARV